MTAPTLERRGDVFILDLGDGENRFNPKRCMALAEAPAEVEAASAPRALVTEPNLEIRRSPRCVVAKPVILSLRLSASMMLGHRRERRQSPGSGDDVSP
jgi:hypothetical protein